MDIIKAEIFNKNILCYFPIWILKQNSSKSGIIIIYDCFNVIGIVIVIPIVNLLYLIGLGLGLGWGALEA